MNEFDFKSQICTSREQSEKLLKLGLRKETADFFIPVKLNPDKESLPCYLDFWISDDPFIKRVREASIPAWSLARLVEMMPKVITLCHPNLHFTMLHDSVHYCNFDYDEEFEQVFSAKNNIYDNIIDCYEWLIKNWYFDEVLLNKEKEK